MLFFISARDPSPSLIRDSNTSHVILYLLRCRKSFCFRIFKYISCYSLSESAKRFKRWVTRFKYISCYSLSFEWGSRTDSRREFKYISCYSLSMQAGLISDSEFDSNTSHVILYRLNFEIQRQSRYHSNTSHVILYPTHFRLFLHYYTSSLLIFQYFIIFYQPYLFSCQILCFFLIFPVFSGFCLTFPCSSPGKIIESRTPLYQYLRFPGFLLQTHCHSSAL